MCTAVSEQTGPPTIKENKKIMKCSLLIAAFALLISAAILPATAQSTPKPKQPAKTNAALKDPSKLNEKAPATFKVKFVTTQGEFIVEATRAWSPLGVDRFYNLVKNGYFDGVKFFRVVSGFVVQFGIHGDPAIAKKWLEANINDEPVKGTNTRGFLTYAKSGAPNSRSVQLFINLGDNHQLDTMGFAPFAKVTKGMEVVDKLYSGYADQPTARQGEIADGGNKFLDQNYPKLDSIKTAVIMK
jgi:peptidyl-prolyl cis-trans isomerase A (cyclophilin A)